MSDQLNLADDEATQPITHRPKWTWFQIGDYDDWFDRAYVPFVLICQLIFTGWLVSQGAWLNVGISFIGIVMLVMLSGYTPIQQALLGREFSRSHVFYIVVFWVYSQLFITFYDVLSGVSITGKDSEAFYIFFLILLAITFRLLVSFFALTPLGYRFFISRIPVWEQYMVAVNEFISVTILGFVAGRLIARFLQPDVFTLNSNVWYNGGLLLIAGAYFLLMQGMWIGIWNRWLSRNNVWVRMARLLTPIALIITSIVIARHFAILSEPRTANLLGTVIVDRTILALSPIFWMMIFFVLIIVYSGGRGLRRMLIPNKLLQHIPDWLKRRLRTISDMDLLLLFALLATAIPVQLFLFGNNAIIGELQTRLQQGNAIIDSSQQALALIFGLPFYIVALLLMILYALVMFNKNISARDRDAVVDKLPLTLLMMFIITLYLAAIPFSQVLSSGRIPNLQQDLGYILAFDVLIPLVLFYIHYYLLIRLPYGFGQTRWRVQHAVILENRLTTVDQDLAALEKNIQQSEVIWRNRSTIRSTHDDQIEMLFDLIELNGKRDRLNMRRLEILADRQALQDVTDAPISLTVATLPQRIFQYGIPLVLAFKIYEWAIVNDGLREVANNPNLGVLEFFQAILEATNF